MNYKESEKQLDDILEGNLGDDDRVIIETIKDMIARGTLDEKRKLLTRLTDKALLYTGNEDMRQVKQRVLFAIDGFSEDYSGDFLKSDVKAAYAKIHNPDSSFGKKVLERSWGDEPVGELDMGWNIDYAAALGEQLVASIDATFFAPAATRAEREKELDLVKQKYLRKLPDLTPQKDMTQSAHDYRHRIINHLCIEANDYERHLHSDYVPSAKQGLALCEELLTEFANRGYLEAQEFLMQQAMSKRDYKAANQWLDKMKNNDVRVEGIPFNHMYRVHIARLSKELGTKEKVTKQAQTVWNKGVRLRKTGRGLITVLKGLRNLDLLQTHKNQQSKH